jgi:hypothetical protein
LEFEARLLAGPEVLAIRSTKLHDVVADSDFGNFKLLFFVCCLARVLEREKKERRKKERKKEREI